MNTQSLKYSLVATFALAGTMALSPVSQALAGETSVAAHTNDGMTARTAVDSNAPTETAKVGDRLEDGTIYAGNNFAATPADAPDLYTWYDGKRYCQDLEINGHADWTLPTKFQLDQLYQHKDTGAFAGTFNDGSGTFNDGGPGTRLVATFLYWTSSEKHSRSNTNLAWVQSFTEDGGYDWGYKYLDELSVRCVRAESVAAHTNDGMTASPAIDSNAPTETAKVGDRLEDGTIYAGNNFAATPADAPDLYTWYDGKRYCQDLEANGHADWTLPTKFQLDRLYQHKDSEAFSGTFKDRAHSSRWLAEAAFWYWTSSEKYSKSNTPFAWAQSFTEDGGYDWSHKDFDELSVRCVRAAPAAP